MLHEILAPNPKKLSLQDFKMLLETFEKVKKACLPSILKQLHNKHPVRQKIDEAWLRVLGYEGDKTQLLDKLYKSLVKEITILKKMMAEEYSSSLAV